jgi:hypothetical protein
VARGSYCDVIHNSKHIASNARAVKEVDEIWNVVAESTYYRDVFIEVVRETEEKVG